MKNFIFITLLLLGISANADPIVRGTWTGYIINGEVKYPTTLYVAYDADGEIEGDITISYNYMSGKTYTCKASFTGTIDYKTYDFNIVLEEYIYYDLLPEGMRWCLGVISGGIRREMELKQYLMLGRMKTVCAETLSEIVLVKQQ